MGDSDDEVDKRNVRDKFKHERNDYDRNDSRRSHDATDRYLCWHHRERPLCTVGLITASGDIGPQRSFIVYRIGPPMWPRHSEKTLEKSRGLE